MFKVNSGGPNTNESLLYTQSRPTSLEAILKSLLGPVRPVHHSEDPLRRYLLCLKPRLTHTIHFWCQL